MRSLGPDDTRYLRRWPTLANLLTLGNLSAGFLAALEVIEADLAEAAALIALAALLDALDGPAARRGRGGASEFGAGLDSLADLISFGMVPALALYLEFFSGAGQPLRGLRLVICIAFVLCGALRLARFSVSRHPLHFVGMPIPPAGLALVSLPTLGIGTLPALCVGAALCLLMVGKFRVPTLRGLAELFDKGRNRPEAEVRGTEEEAGT